MIDDRDLRCLMDPQRWHSESTGGKEYWVWEAPSATASPVVLIEELLQRERDAA